MAIELKQSLKQTQNLVMSPQMQQAIKILTLARQELEDFLSEELRENPCLEEGDGGSEFDERTVAPPADEASMDARADAAKDQIQNEVAKELEVGADLRGLDELLARFEESTQGTGENRFLEADELDTPMYDRIRTDNASLHEDLEEQLRMMHLTGYEQECAMVLLQYLDDNGFLTADIDEVARENGLELADLEYALEMLQKCEPVGVGARSLQECLLLQLDALDEACPHAERILKDHWPDFEKQDVNKIARALKAKPDEIKKAIVFIRGHLDPRPARQYGANTSQAVTPDVFLFKREGEWVVSLNEDGLPRLRISAKYEGLIAAVTAERKKDEGQAKLKDFINTKMKNARHVLNALSERNKTILRVAEVILARQRDFFELGVEHLRPLTLKIVADELGLHESTISRATTNKYLHSPRGIFDLKYFFNAGMSSQDGSELANEAVKNWVGEYIRNERPGDTLSDQDISDLIAKEKALKVARRTVAKYREALGLLPSSKRAKKF